MEISIGRTVNISDPIPEIKTWCKKNLTIPNPDYIKKVRMSLWTGNTPKQLTLYEQKGNTLILPYGVIKDLFAIPRPIVKLTSTFGKKHEVEYHAEVPLYDYQDTAVTEMLNANYGILQSPAGSGKTQMGIAIIARLGLRALWITHTRDLLRQSKVRAERYMDSSLLGTITEGKVSVGEGITFATVQTLARLDLREYENYWDVIVVDECHRVAGTPTALTQFYTVLNSLSARHKYGLSATVHRTDGMIKATYSLLGSVAYIVPDEAVADKIMQVGIYPCSTGIGVSTEFQNTDGTINYPRMLSYLTNSINRNREIIKRIMENEGQPSLILSDRLHHLETLMSLLPPAMVKDAVMVSGKMTSKACKAARDQAIEDMRSGKKKYLFATYALAKEGLDIPRLERLYLTTPQKDYAVVAQSVGRIARTFDGKKPPICYDFVDDIGYLFRAYKKRCTAYRKIGCYFITEESL